MPFFAGALGNFIGGFAGDFIVTRIGVKWAGEPSEAVELAAFGSVYSSAALSANRVAAIPTLRRLAGPT